jgi:hypothetical protein
MFNTPTRSRAFWLGLLILVAAVSWLVTPSVPDLDDAYIPLHSADSILDGADGQYGTAPLVGITSPPYLLLLTALREVGLPDLVALRLGSATGLIALVVAIWMLARSVGLSDWQRVLLSLLVLLSGAVIEQAVNGVETGWAMAIAVALIAACLSKHSLAVAVLAAILPWLRPDLAPLAGLLFLFTIWSIDRVARVRAIATALTMFVPWAIWLHWQTGAWFPNTMAAKAAFYAASCQPALTKFSLVAFAIALWVTSTVPASVLAAFWVWRESIGLAVLIATLFTLAAYLVVFPVGLFHNHQRYMFPIGIPLIALGLAYSLRSPKPIWRSVAPVVTVFLSLVLLPGRLWESQGPERVAAAQWVREHVNPKAKLMVQDAGVFSIYVANPLVDFVGLKTPSSAEQHRRLTWTSCGRNRAKAIAEIARSSGAEYLIVTTDWDQAFSITSGLTDEGLELREIRSPPEGQYGYCIYQIKQS